MRKLWIRNCFLVVLSVWLLALTGCESDAQTDALIGGAIGAGVGQAIGRDTEGTLIGAAVGAGAGYVIGAQSDKKKAEQQRQQEVYSQPADTPAGTTETVWITNSNGSKTPVFLRKEGNYWYGPKGERYDTKPTEEQLRTVYGF
jgi:hypothetical protein